MTSIPITESNATRIPFSAPPARVASRGRIAHAADAAPAAPPSPEHNRLLAALGDDTIARLLPQAALRSLGARETLCLEDDAADAVYFPLNGMLSLLARAGDQVVEVGTVGAEGMFGNPFLFSSRTYGFRAVAPFRTTVLRLDAAVARDLFVQRGPAAEKARRQAGVLVAQLGRVAACHHWHDVPGRCARWMLLARERAGDHFTVTQELLAELLGVRRASVNGAATRLQRLGAIDYSRGRVKITDANVLQAAACPCYGAFRAELLQLNA